LPQRKLSCSTTVQHNFVAVHGNAVPAIFVLRQVLIGVLFVKKIFLEVRVCKQNVRP